LVVSVVVVDELSAGAGVVAGGVVAVESDGAGVAVAGAEVELSAGAVAGAGDGSGAGAGAGLVVVVVVVSSFLPQATSETANSEATSRVFFMIPSLGE